MKSPTQREGKGILDATWCNVHLLNQLLPSHEFVAQGLDEMLELMKQKEENGLKSRELDQLYACE